MGSKGFMLSFMMLLGAILLSAAPAGAYWSDRYGGTELLNHCVPSESSRWSTPGLRFGHTTDHAAYVEAIFVFPADHRDDANLSVIHVADGLAWRVFDGRLGLLQTRSFNEPVRDDFPFRDSLLLTEAFPSVDGGPPEFVNIMNFNKVPWMMNQKLEKIGEFRRVGLAPVVDESDADGYPMLPAVGDFAGRAGVVLIFPGRDEWMAFSPDGNQMARNTVVDKYDVATNHAHSHREDGQDYAYITTGNINFINDPDPTFKKRIHKVSLEPNPSGFPLPYSFRKIWTTELPGHNLETAMAFTDVNGDGEDEIVLEGRQLRTPDGRAFAVLSLDGQVIYQPPLGVNAHIAVGDANGDGRQEIIALAYAEYAGEGRDFPLNESWVIGYQVERGQLREIYRFPADPVRAGYYIVACDVNGDGADEILTVTNKISTRVWSHNPYRRFGEGQAQLFTFNGTKLWDYVSPHGIIMAPVISDLDRDGAYEIALGNEWAQFLVFDPDVAPSPRDFDEPLEQLHAHDLLSDDEFQELLAVGPTSAPGPPSDGGKKGNRGTPDVEATILLLSLVAVASVARHLTRKP